jgi:hypothetical protein
MSMPFDLVLRRRDLGVAGMALGLGAVARPEPASAAGAILRGLEDLKDGTEEELAYVRAMLAYVYGFPLVMMDLTRKVLTATPTSGEYAAPINQWTRMRTPVRWDFNNVVRISVNSLWSVAFLDLANGPSVMTLPDCKNIPFAFRLLNHWTDVFGTAGSRTPERNAGNYLVAGPGWEGSAPADIKQVFRSPTRYAWALVEMSAAGPQDYPTIHALEDQLQATPLGAWGTPYKPPATVPVDSNVDLSATPYDQVRLMTGERFFMELAPLLKDNPPYPGDTTQIDRLRKLGIEPGKEFDPGKMNPAVRKGINDAPAEVWKKFATGPYGMNAPNGWINLLNIARFGSDYQTRAYVAYMGLGAGVADDIVYPSAFVDGDGNALDAGYNYVIHLNKGDMDLSHIGVWSISAYRENFYTQNPLNRYGMLPSMPKYNPDGSLDVYLQAKSPGPEKESNWLPIPQSGIFNLTMRIYDPKKEALSETLKLPPVKKVGVA